MVRGELLLKWLFYLILLVITISLFTIVIPYFFFPGFFFPHHIGTGDDLANVSLSLRADNQLQTLTNVYVFMNDHFSNERYYLYLQFYKHFYISADKLILNDQFLPCHLQSLVAKSLLISTGQFSEGDFHERITLSRGLMIHKFFEVRVGDNSYLFDSFLDKFGKL